MACASCGTTTANGTPSGCGSKGSCSSGGCNRLSTYDWLSRSGVRDVADQQYVEVSFKHGTRKDFYLSPPAVGAHNGDVVVVSTDFGFDTGYITLSGELTLAQMRRKKSKPSNVTYEVVRIAHERDRARLDEARVLERNALVRSRAIAYATDLPMKMSDVEYQGDLRKATFYYTSDSRIDFRELIKELAKEFGVRVEMRQIGARQEAARIGGVGSCGRELCCSTWITEFASVTTSAARYQGLALNQTKLSGQCGRLKCCLNYELDTYLDALQDFPKKADKIRLPSGKAVLVKTDVFKGLMHYQVMKGRVRGPFVTMTVAQVKEVLANPDADVNTFVAIEQERQRSIAAATADEHTYDDTTGAIDIPLEKRRRKKKGPSGGGNKSRSRSQGRSNTSDDAGDSKSGGDAGGRTSSRNKSRGPGGGGRRKSKGNASAKPNSEQSNSNPSSGGGNSGGGNGGGERNNPDGNAGKPSSKGPRRRNRGRGRSGPPKGGNNQGGGPNTGGPKPSGGADS